MAASNEYKLISADVARASSRPTIFEARPPGEPARPRAEARRARRRERLARRRLRAGAAAGDRGDGYRVGTGPPTVRSRTDRWRGTRCCPRCTTRPSASRRSGPTASTPRSSTRRPGLWDAIKQLDDDELKLALVAGVQRLARRVLRATSPTGCSGWRSCRPRASRTRRPSCCGASNELGLRGAVARRVAERRARRREPGRRPVLGDGQRSARADQPALRRRRRRRSTTPPSGIAPGLRPPMADALLPMVAAGVFDRYPDVKVVFAHGDAGWALHWMEFFDINYVRHKHLVGVRAAGSRRRAVGVHAPARVVHVPPGSSGGEEPAPARCRAPDVGEPLPVRRLELARQPPAGDARHRRGAARRAAGAARRQRRAALPAARLRRRVHRATRWRRSSSSCTSRSE